jgi:spore maturation protein CgeB
MAMKFLIVNKEYRDFLDWLYTSHPGLETEPYEKQMQVRMESLFFFANFYSSNLRQLGHEAREIHINNGWMQKAWAREHGVRFQSSWRQRVKSWMKRGRHSDYEKWMYEILAAQIKYYRPDVLLNQNISYSSRFFGEMKPYVRLLIGQHAARLPSNERDYSVYDLMISSLPNFVDYFRHQGLSSELHRLAFEPTVLRRLGEVRKKTAVSFVGSLHPAHNFRRYWLAHLCRRIPVNVWGSYINKLPGDSPILRNFHGNAWGLEVYQLLQNSRITLNYHIDEAEAYANNLRLFEATGVGTLLITDWKKNLHDLFEPGKEVVAYRTPEECVELIQHYLTHDDEREAIATAGQQRTLREHTYNHRMQELVDMVNSRLRR